MLEKKMSSAAGMMLGVLLIAGTAAQASAQATQDTTKGAKDTSAYSAPQPADTGAPAVAPTTPTGQDTASMKAPADTGMGKMGSDSGMAGMGHDSMAVDTSTKAGKKAWKKKHKKMADSTSAK